MANIKSAKKRVITDAKRGVRNNRVRVRYRSAEKAFLAAVNAGDYDDAKEKFVTVEKELMKAASKNVLHKNTAARKVGRLEKRLNTLKEN